MHSFQLPPPAPPLYTQPFRLYLYLRRDRHRCWWFEDHVSAESALHPSVLFLCYFFTKKPFMNKNLVESIEYVFMRAFVSLWLTSTERSTFNSSLLALPPQPLYPALSYPFTAPRFWIEPFKRTRKSETIFKETRGPKLATTASRRLCVSASNVHSNREAITSKRDKAGPTPIHFVIRWVFRGDVVSVPV